MKSFVALIVLFGVAVAHPTQLDGKIVGGEDTTIEKFPYQLSLQYNGKHMCGASRISDDWVLTAAHCAGEGPSRAYSVRAESSIRNSGGFVYKIDRVIIHEKYNPDTMSNDLALMKVKSPFENTPGSQRIQLVESGVEPTPGLMATVSGWGTLSAGGSAPSQLQMVQVPIVDRATCKKAYDNFDATMFCAGYENGGKDACQGDSGGPIVANGAQIGVVSWGKGCAAKNKPGVYSHIGNAEIRKWISTVAGI